MLGGHRRLQRVIQRSLSLRQVPALLCRAQVGAPAILLAGSIDLDLTRSDAHDPHQLSLGLEVATRHAGPHRYGLDRLGSLHGVTSVPTVAGTGSSCPLTAAESSRPTAPAPLMSTRQPVSLAARRAFCPSLPIARESMPSGTTISARLLGPSILTDVTSAGLRALPTNRAGSSSY